MACAANSTFANVKSSLMIPRQPEVPNFMTDMRRIIALRVCSSTGIRVLLALSYPIDALLPSANLQPTCAGKMTEDSRQALIGKVTISPPPDWVEVLSVDASFLPAELGHLSILLLDDQYHAETGQHYRRI